MTVQLPKFEVKSTAVEKMVDPLLDVGNLLLIDRDPIEDEIKDNLLERARDNTQFLFNNVWELEKKHVDSAILAVLPPPTYRLPREKRLPEKKEPTKWEAYAQQKGIKKRVKAKKAFDDKTKEWKPTYGYNRGNDNTKDWLVEVPGGADPNRDYFAEREDKKKERVAKNETQRLKNLAKQLQTKVKKGPSVDSSIGVGVAPEEKTKQQVRFAVDRAKTATASAGKFQRSVKGEKENIKTGKKRKFESNVADVSNEKERALGILEKMKSKKAKIVEEKATAIAGPEKREKKEHTGKGSNQPARQKSQIHRQQWYKNKKDTKKKSGGNKVRKTGKGKK